MEHHSKIIVSTERDEEFEKARIKRLRGDFEQDFLAFKDEVLEIAGKVNGLGSSRFAVGHQKLYQVTPGGPRNLDLDDNSLCRHTPSPPPNIAKMSVLTGNKDLASHLSKLGGLNDSRFSPKVHDNAINKFNFQSSSGESTFKANAIISTPTKPKSISPSLSGSAKSFTPRSLEESPSSGGGGVPLAPCSTTVVKDGAVKKPTPEKLIEQRLMADFHKRMGKSQNTNSRRVDSANEAIMVPVLSPVAIVPDAKANTTVNENISVAGQELFAAIGSVAPSSIPTTHTTSSPVQASAPGGASSESCPLTAPIQTVISGRSLMREDEFMRMLLKDKQEKDLKRKLIAAPKSITQSENLKVNIQQLKSDSPPSSSNPPLLSLQPQTFTDDEVNSNNNNNFENKLESPGTEKSTFPQRQNSHTKMSNKPLIPAPFNSWTTAKLTQGKTLSKADEDFQTFIANKAAAHAEVRAQQQTVLQPTSPKPAPRKPTQAEANAEKRKLAAGTADFSVFLARRFADPPSIKKENVFSAKPFAEKGVSVMSTIDDNHTNTAISLAALKGESSQDKISHVAVHSFAPKENQAAILANTQVNGSLNGKLMGNLNQAVSIVSSPPFWSISSFSDIGDKLKKADIGTESKEGVRLSETKDANLILRDWDGNWCTPPIWEERGAFDSAYIPSYIHEWSNNVSPVQPVTITIDTSAEGFRSGEYVVNNVVLSKAPHHEPTIPDILNASDEQKRLHQTAAKDAAAHFQNVERARKAQERAVIVSNAHYERQMAEDSEPNTSAPKIEIYLRPATEADAKHILEIYNHYVRESYIPEDQEPVTQNDILYLIQVNKKEKLPFVVAVKGCIPAKSANPKVKTKLPQYENIVGFGYTEIRGCGLTGRSNGRSRFTHNLHFYVHPEYTRKGIGGCVLDSLLVVSSRAWSSNGGYNWLNPDNDPAYGHGCGARCHQLIIEVPVKKDDPNYDWMKKFLRNFWFLDEIRLISVGRTSVLKSPVEWLDVVHFQKELEHSGEFTHMV
ncbi:putative acyl- n-acyltransferase protein [Botrytis fragariae]|uniref:Putative acyl- n-acyltransferase protein n=1 Tax=Botrytis fragariae TaxID=1964551 RepID=A0A8H6AUA0_9HELO|nr:putative acyl- n-acyltransferase protein [Botrytis fragariae]KAF5873836.1 putative acyl- n-acyltransferase protein [Botrytis fragariae]